MLNKKILIAEDDVHLLSLLCDKLRNEIDTVIEARDGEEAIKSALKSHPDLLILDIKMPKKDGLIVLSELRKDAWGKKVPVLMLTNVDDPDNVTEALKHQATDYLLKSEWSLDEIVKKVKAILV